MMDYSDHVYCEECGDCITCDMCMCEENRKNKMTHLYKTYHIGTTTVSLTPNVSENIRRLYSLNEDDVITDKHVKCFIDRMELIINTEFTRSTHCTPS